MPTRKPTPAHNLKTTRKGKVKKRSVLWRWRRAFFLLGVAVVAAFAGTAWVLSQVKLPPSEPPQLQTSFICTAEVTPQQGCSDGNAIASLHGSVNRVEITDLAQVPPLVQHAVLAAEDKNFFKHGGVDPVGIGRAALNDLTNGSKSQGGSTITQQYVRNVYLNQQRTWTRKLKEAVLAVKIEQKLSKKEIFRRYLNTIYFGRGAYGIQAASQVYFGVDVSKLNASQAAFLAGIIRSPGTDPKIPSQTAYATELRHFVLDGMVKQKWLTPQQQQLAEAVPITDGMLDYTPTNGMTWKGGAFGADPTAAGSQYFVDYARQQLVKLVGEQQAYGGGLRVYTTLDPRLQQDAYNSVTSTLHNSLSFKPQPQAALVSVNSQGQVVAMISGDRPFGSGPGESQVNLAAGSAGGGSGRQPGSTFKAFAVAQAVHSGMSIRTTFNAPSVGYYPWYTDKSGKAIPVASGESGTFDLVSATAQSVNTVFVPLIHQLGVDKVRNMAYSLGIDPKNSNLATAREALVLGGGEVAPIGMATAYNSFANNGSHIPTSVISRIEDSKGRVVWSADQSRTPVITPDENAKVVYCLQRVLVSGTAAGKGLGYDSAGKTGTTDNNADGWFVGFTPGQLTTAVWMGYPDVDPTTGKLRTMPRGVDGGTYPTDIWHDFMIQALQNAPHPQFPAAANVNSGNVADSGGAVTSAPNSSPSSPRRSTPRSSTSTTVRETTSTSSTTKPSVTVPGGGGGGGGGPGH